MDIRSMKEGESGNSSALIIKEQKIEGNILVDGLSALDFTMKDGADFTGAVNPQGEEGEVHVKMENGAKWTLTGNSYVDSFEGDTSSVVSNGYHLYVLGELII